MDQLCFDSGQSLLAIATAVISGAAMIANFVPAPDKVNNKALRILSRIVHYAAADIVTAKK